MSCEANAVVLETMVQKGQESPAAGGRSGELLEGPPEEEVDVEAVLPPVAVRGRGDGGAMTRHTDEPRRPTGGAPPRRSGACVGPSPSACMLGGGPSEGKNGVQVQGSSSGRLGALCNAHQGAARTTLLKARVGVCGAIYKSACGPCRTPPPEEAGVVSKGRGVAGDLSVTHMIGPKIVHAS